MLLDDEEIIEVEFPNDITIYPISDFHYGASGCCKKIFEDTLEIVKNDPNAYMVLVGDIFDMGVMLGKNLGVYDQVITPQRAIDDMIEMLKPVKGKIIGAISGNHEYRVTKATTLSPMYDVMCRLGIEDKYRENKAYIVCRIGDKKHRNGLRHHTYTIMLHHGKGTMWTAPKIDENFVGYEEGVDILITGHTHKPVWTSFSHNFIPNKGKRIGKRLGTILVCTALLGDAEYAKRGMMPPSIICKSKIQLFASSRDKKVTTICNF